ncbi:MAG TPA: 3-deoxy-7-phosphoheptulonate synthase [Candidatus Paceibacterota bacterium]|nr:3-deoxy-7-phosphoheptulonate synthase [Candidatus Paceibacterota bacterium]HMP18716.1 3-deoxy-7-phosphoheptulonate synthase [Candidatus Paceibacterota bacterium]HMP85491.1 3-deoxy-7-phosphoheptulonate synthase [Candidatus Paceibacterota bacterium]
MLDFGIKSIKSIPTPDGLREEFPLPKEIFSKVVNPARETIKAIIDGEDTRLLLLVGPCSVHNADEAFEYAKKLSELIPKVKDKIFIAMRVCLDKPRTGRGWTGFFQDPDLNESRNIDKGWREGRKLIIKILSLGIPVSMELLDVDARQNLDDVVSYWWIGARTTTSQRLREIASGLSAPVGFKNPTDGKIDSAVEAIDTARHEASFVAANGKGVRCVYYTCGNKNGHLILRGFDGGPNYSAKDVSDAIKKLANRGLPQKVLIDVSHANSGKDYRKQKDIITEIGTRIASGEKGIAGFLYESYLQEGNQKIPKDIASIKPNVSVTDSCDSFETTEKVILSLREILK